MGRSRAKKQAVISLEGNGAGGAVLDGLPLPAAAIHSHPNPPLFPGLRTRAGHAEDRRRSDLATPIRRTDRASGLALAKAAAALLGTESWCALALRLLGRGAWLAWWL
jgi:hypothetical protein